MVKKVSSVKRHTRTGERAPIGHTRNTDWPAAVASRGGPPHRTRRRGV